MTREAREFKEKEGGAPVKKAGGFRRRKTCPFQGERINDIDYKNVKLLKRYISPRGKIMPSRITAVSQKAQRKLSQEIKRARFLALIAYVNQEGA